MKEPFLSIEHYEGGIHLDAGIAGLYGAAIGAAGVIIGSVISNWFNIQKEKEQWIRDKDAKLNDWQRDKLEDIYGNCINSLSKLFRRSEITAEVGAIIKKEHVRDLFDDYTDAQKWLSLLLIHYPSEFLTPSSHSNTLDFNNFKDKVSDFSMKGIPDMGKARELLELVIELAKSDPRLQVRPSVTQKCS